MFTWISRKKHEELYQKNKNLWYKSYGNKLDEWTSLALEEGWCYNYSEFEGIDEARHFYKVITIDEWKDRSDFNGKLSNYKGTFASVCNVTLILDISQYDASFTAMPAAMVNDKGYFRHLRHSTSQKRFQLYRFLFGEYDISYEINAESFKDFEKKIRHEAKSFDIENNIRYIL
jgi:hypothetical protein